MASPFTVAALMKVTLNWLKQYVDFDWSSEVLAERLTMLGLEVESVHKIAGDFEGIVIAQILSKDKMPGSDKLTACRVNDGRGERTIICGAQNHNVGDKVPMILPNFSLPLKPGEKEPFVIKERKVFGITSQGMMCSPQELGLPDAVDGLLILPKDAPVGQPFAQFRGRASGDVVYDLEVTPNRPDWNSVIGIAREIAALTGNALKMPELKAGNAAGEPADQLVGVRIEDPELCPRYTARVIRGLKIGASPDWLRSILERVGVRSINNVVDATNYVMLEIGQPLHAFDYHLVSTGNGREQKPTIIVRRAADGEKFVTLDGQERLLAADMLLIADEQKAIALAGIMGGQNSEIQPGTVDVLLESACFQASNIRRTSKTLSLRTDASYRFERGSDVGICDWASQRCADLILAMAGGSLAKGVVDGYPKPVPPRRITLRHKKVNELLGIQLRPEESGFYLGQLGLKAVDRKPRPVDLDNVSPEPVTFQIPSFRIDLKREVDLIEEIGRLHGVEEIPAKPPRGAIGANPFDAVHDTIAEARRVLCGLGLNEAQGQTLVSSEDCRFSGAATVPLVNPLSADMDVLRPSLLPGLLRILRHNISRKNDDLALFEIGRVFFPASTGEGEAEGNAARGPMEQRRLGIALTGGRNRLFWSGAERDAKLDAYDLKGLLEEFSEQFGLRGLVYTRRPESTSLFLESATIQLGRQQVGEFGQLLPTLAKRYDLRDAVLLAELDFDLILSRRSTAKNYKPLPAFPAVRWDVAMIVAESTTHDAVLQAVKQAKAVNLESVELFDVFRGKNVPANSKSMAYAFTYRHPERTLTDAEVNAAHEKIVLQLKTSLQAIIRE
ncbi:MAG TPA: phenylalanine--tRNA ligase subunit beta [Verrucomicrobiae bacterium]|nr:phenylalanine--tRNA ligase subunit beta [Verrucomicrobiae bacterium]